MSFFVRHTIALAIVVVALAAVGGVFAFARPEFRPAQQGKSYDLSYVTLPVAASGARGWTWPGSVPGFQFGQDEEVWQGSNGGVHSDDFSSGREAASRAGVDPESLRVLHTVHVGSSEGNHSLTLVAGTDSAKRVCIGGVIPRTPTSFFCPDAAPSRRLLGDQVAFVAAATLPAKVDPKHGRLYGLFGVAVVRGDVTRVKLDIPGITHVSVYDRTYVMVKYIYSWGTFALGFDYPRPWHGTLTFYGRHGLLGSLPLTSHQPAERFMPVSSARN